MTELVAAVHAFVKERFLSFEGSHDWFHIERVWKTAKHLQKIEGGKQVWKVE